MPWITVSMFVLRKTLRRDRMAAFFTQLSPCLIGIEACGSAHYWARELTRMGHTVRIIPPRLVKPYLKGQKNDANDAEAICEAVSRPGMRFVAIRTERPADAAGGAPRPGQTHPCPDSPEQ
ncbi:transposase, IS110 family [Klebsiella oxytoca]|nr:transposase, IS110 family [Klebsiella oxytoca]